MLSQCSFMFGVKRTSECGHVWSMHIAQQAEGWTILQTRGMQLLVQLHSVPDAHKSKLFSSSQREHSTVLNRAIMQVSWSQCCTSAQAARLCTGQRPGHRRMHLLISLSDNKEGLPPSCVCRSRSQKQQALDGRRRPAGVESRF